MIRFILLLVCVFPMTSVQAEILQLRGSIVLAQILNLASAELKKDHGIDVRIISEGGSTPAIMSLIKEDVIDMAITTREMTATEIAQEPEKEFTVTKIGTQAIAVTVGDAVWEGGFHVISRKQAIDLYEQEVKNWKQIGGPDRDVKFFHRDPERGVWEVFALWGYGEVRKAPRPKGEILHDPADVLNSMHFNSGAISFLEVGALDKSVHTLGIQLADGSIVEPTIPTIAAGKYPLARPLLLIGNGKPTGHLRTLIEFMLSEKGQAYVKKANHLTVADLTSPK